MKEPGKVSRRSLLKRLLLAVAIGPLVKLTSAVAKAEKRRRHHAGADPDDFWIGHC
jgi:hypothetical protein